MNTIVSKIGMLVVIMMLTACQATGTRPTQHAAPNPEAAETNMRLGLSYLQRGDYAVALEKLDKALQQNPNLPSAHNTIALLYQRLGETEKAEKHFKEAVQRQPDYSEAQNNFGVFLCQQARYDEAEKHFLAAIENPLYNNPALALENAGMCAQRKPDLERAEALFRQALQRAPTLSKSLLQMADISYQQKDYLQARAYIERYQAVSQWTPKSLLLAIKTENQLGDQDAVSSYTLLMRSRFPDSNELKQVKEGNY